VTRQRHAFSLRAIKESVSLPEVPTQTAVLRCIIDGRQNQNQLHDFMLAISNSKMNHGTYCFFGSARNPAVGGEKPAGCMSLRKRKKFSR
jgi:hypothetical protein